MKKILYITLFVSSALFSATPKQVDQYLLFSHSEEQLINLETQFSQMENRIYGSNTDATEYDTQMLSIRFREYLERELSESEMNDVLQNYKNETFLKFVYETSGNSYDRSAAAQYIARLKENPESKTRIDLIEKINNFYSNKDGIISIFNTIVKPIMTKMMPAKTDSKFLKKIQKRYVKAMRESSRREILYDTRNFTIEELDKLLKVMETPAMDHEIKAVYGAMSYSLQDFIKSIASRISQVHKHH